MPLLRRKPQPQYRFFWKNTLPKSKNNTCHHYNNTTDKFHNNFNQMKKGFFHTLHVLISLAVLIWAIDLYLRYGTTPHGIMGFAVLLIFMAIPIIFRIMTLVFMLTTLLSLCTIGYIYFKYFKT